MAQIEKRSKNTYRLTVSCGYDKDGKQIRKRKTIELDEKLTERQREKELQKQAVLFEQEVVNGRYLDGEKVTFAEFTEIWLRDYAEKNLTPSTLVSYISKLNHRILPAIGHIKLSKLQPQHLLAFFNGLDKEDARDDYRCVPSDGMIKLTNEMHEPCMQNKIGINIRTYANVKNGKPIKYETAEKLCSFYKIRFEEAFLVSGQDKELSNKTKRHHQGIVSTILSTAVKWNILANNVADRVENIKVKKRPASYYDEEDVAQLFHALESEPIKYKTIIYLAIDTGLRTGELAGLKWPSVNLADKTISINTQRQYVNGYGVIEKEPKTQSGIRTLTISETMAGLLNRFRLHQKEMKLKLGTAWMENEYVFVHDDGKPLYPRRPYIWFMDFLEKNNFKKITVHQLRHTNASLLISDGIDIVTLSNRLGHAEKSITLNTYSHLIKRKEQLAANTMDKFYRKAGAEK